MSLEEIEQQAYQLGETDLRALIGRLTTHQRQRLEQSVSTTDEVPELVKRYNQCLDALLATSNILPVELLLTQVQALLADLEAYGRRTGIDVFDLAVYEYLAGMEELLADQQEQAQATEPEKEDENHFWLTPETRQTLQGWRVNELI